MRRIPLSALPLLVGALSCTGSSDAVTAGPVRTVLDDGREVVRYAALDRARAAGIAPDLSIGVLDGDAMKTFGDIRGVDVDADGTIYIFDTQASEIRAFDAEGAYLRTVASRGEGPGEIVEANGILFRNGLIWVHDHGQWQLLGLRPEGGEAERHPLHVRSYAYIWTGTVDRAGRVWKTDFPSPEPRTRQEGLNEGSYLTVEKWYALSDGSTDSIYTGEHRARRYTSRMGRGFMHRGIPFDPYPSTAIDPDGGLWTTEGDRYRIARLDLSGDTTLVLEVSEPPAPVTRRDRRDFLDTMSEESPGVQQIADDLMALMPEHRPTITALSVDDEGRLWVKRTTREEAHARYDVFTRDAEFLGAVELDFEAASYFPARVRYGHLYTIVRDELFVPSEVRAPLPEWLRSGGPGPTPP